MAQAERQYDESAFSPDRSGETGRRTDSPEEAAAGIERRRHDRITFETTAERDRRISAENDRRRSERRAVDAMRSELKYTVAQDRRGASIRRPGVKPSRVLLLAVSIVAGGLAAFLAVQQPAPIVAEPIEAAPVQVEQEPRVPVLVASQAVAAGQRVTAGMLTWQDWPVANVVDGYITAEQSPNAELDYVDAVAKVDLLPGEPVRDQRLALGATGGLAVLLSENARAVSVAVTADAASGGFIGPDDRVDVLLTKQTGGLQSANVILENVRVLAIGEDTGLGSAESRDGEIIASDRVFADQAIATLELDPYQAQTVISATEMGKLTLVLRPMDADEGENKTKASGLNQTIRLTSPFWNPQAVPGRD